MKYQHSASTQDHVFRILTSHLVSVSVDYVVEPGFKHIARHNAF